MLLKKAILFLFVGFGLIIVSCTTDSTIPLESENESTETIIPLSLATKTNPIEEIVSPTIPSSTISRNLLDISPQPRSLHAMVYDTQRNVIVLFGGYSRLSKEDEGGALNDTWEYDGVTWRRIETAVSPSPRSGHTMAYDNKRGVVILFGGNSADSPLLNDTWLYNGVSWQQQTNLLISPPRRSHATMSYDPRTETVLLFGGYSGYSANDLWEYDGLNWKQLDVELVETRLMYNPTFPKIVYGGNYGIVAFTEDSIFSYTDQKWDVLSEPSANDVGLNQIFLLTAFSFDARRNIFVLFGGQNIPNDTWEFDGNSWNRYESPLSLTARSEHAMVFDSEKNVTVLFGGADQDGTFLNDTWEYDGTTWVQR